MSSASAALGTRRSAKAANGTHVLVVGLAEPLLRIHHVIMRMPHPPDRSSRR